MDIMIWETSLTVFLVSIGVKVVLAALSVIVAKEIIDKHLQVIVFVKMAFMIQEI